MWAWLCCDQNVDAVARELHIRRNTMRYRITRHPLSDTRYRVGKLRNGLAGPS
ncbi:MAG: helix-turn-helix domain-containing protein [Mycobacterium sp.]